MTELHRHSRAGYLQGGQGIELKDLTHTQDQEFTKGYLKGIQGYWWNTGLVEGYTDYHRLYRIKTTLMHTSQNTRIM